MTSASSKQNAPVLPGLFEAGGQVDTRPSDPVARHRDELLERIAQRTEADTPGFMARAQAFVVAYLEAHGPTSGEALTTACKAAGITPAKDDRAFGPVYMGLARDGKIVKVGTARRERGHGTAGGNIWGPL